jgi:hypothetical protein
MYFLIIKLLFNLWLVTNWQCIISHKKEDLIFFVEKLWLQKLNPVILEIIPIIQFQVIACTNVIVLIFVAYGDVNDKVTTNKWPFVKSSCYSSIGPIVFDDEIGDFFVYKILLGFPYFWGKMCFFYYKFNFFSILLEIFSIFVISQNSIKNTWTMKLSY